MKIVKILGGIVAVLVVLAASTIGLLHTDYVQQRAKEQVLTLLKEQIGTNVTLDNVSISLFGEDVSISGLTVPDLQDRKMLELEHVGVEVDLWRLLKHEVYITEAQVRGLTARIYQPRRDTAANFQFIVDAFKKKPKAKPDSTATGSTKKQKLQLGVGKLRLERIALTLNDTTSAEIGSLMFKENWRGRKVGELREAKAFFVQRTKKGPVDSWLRLGVVGFQQQEKQSLLTIDSLCFFTDNHKPRRNVGKPKRGFFDAGHLDVVAKLNLRLDAIAKDSIVGAITNMQLVDRGSGINVTNLNSRLRYTKQKLLLRDVSVRLPNTEVKFDWAEMTLPSKKEGRPMSYSTSKITGTTKLKDIAKPFARVLHKFEQPVEFSTWMTGDKDGMQFRNVTVNTPDRKLTIKARGYISGLKDKYALHVHFDVQNMRTTGKEAEHIINQFVVKKFMMKQLNALGTLTFQGFFDVLYKREKFDGTLNTTAGPLMVHFELDELDKYVFGMARTPSLELGKVMGMPDIGKIAAKANFKFDISKPRTAQMRKVKGGKLPIGHVDAQIDQVNYKGMKFTNIQATIDSDGAVAEGFIKSPGSFATLSCAFSFTNTNEMQKTKIKPGIRFHLFDKKSDESKADKDKEKAARKAAKAEEKAARKAAKEKEKAAKEKEEAARKAAKAAEKAARKAAKAEAKAARKAAKEKEKAEKAARKAAEAAAKE